VSVFRQQRRLADATEPVEVQHRERRLAGQKSGAEELELRPAPHEPLTPGGGQTIGEPEGPLDAHRIRRRG
jgi:hypothetical protein